MYSPFQSSFPTIIVAKDINGDEFILTNEYTLDIESFLNRYFSNIKRNTVLQNQRANEWASFLKDVLESKQIVPDSYMLPDDQVREELCISSRRKLTDLQRISAELQVTQQEIISLLYADYVL